MNAMTDTPKPQQLVQPDPSPTYSADDLLQGSSTANIVLNDSVYTLRMTRSGKLILTK